jgi:hypothetical protein
MNNVKYLSSEYATVDREGRVLYEKEGEKLCLINTECDNVPGWKDNLQRFG